MIRREWVTKMQSDAMFFQRALRKAYFVGLSHGFEEAQSTARMLEGINYRHAKNQLDRTLEKLSQRLCEGEKLWLLDSPYEQSSSKV